MGTVPGWTGAGSPSAKLPSTRVREGVPGSRPASHSRNNAKTLHLKRRGFSLKGPEWKATVAIAETPLRAQQPGPSVQLGGGHRTPGECVCCPYGLGTPLLPQPVAQCPSLP